MFGSKNINVDDLQEKIIKISQKKAYKKYNGAFHQLFKEKIKHVMRSTKLFLAG